MSNGSKEYLVDQNCAEEVEDTLLRFHRPLFPINKEKTKKEVNQIVE